MRFAVGEIVVDVIVDDDDFELPLGEFLPGLDLAALGEHRGLLEPEFIDLARNALKCAIQTFVLHLAGRRTLLVDTCIGEHNDRPEIPAWNRRSGTGFHERLRRAGGRSCGGRCRVLHPSAHRPCRLEHPARGRQVGADFPNARYLVGRAELADWLARRDAGTAEAMHVRGLEDSVLPVLEAGLIDLVDDGHELDRGLALTALPGHTAGQMGLRIDRRRARAIFCGDAVHSPAQILTSRFRTACDTRRTSGRSIPAIRSPASGAAGRRWWSGC